MRHTTSASGGTDKEMTHADPADSARGPALAAAAWRGGNPRGCGVRHIQLGEAYVAGDVGNTRQPLVLDKLNVEQATLETAPSPTRTLGPVRSPFKPLRRVAPGTWGYNAGGPIPESDPSLPAQTIQPVGRPHSRAVKARDARPSSALGPDTGWFVLRRVRRGSDWYRGRLDWFPRWPGGDRNV